jgi:hypothetical protein
MTSPRPQGELTVERMCLLARVSRAGYYRHWAVCQPREEATAVRDAVQRVALANRRYGYRRIAAQLRRDGLAVNHKRVLRLMREDNLLCLRTRPFVPMTTDSRHRGVWCRTWRAAWCRAASTSSGWQTLPMFGCWRSLRFWRCCLMPSAAGDRLGARDAFAREPRFERA